MSVNLAETIALSHALLKMASRPRGRDDVCGLRREPPDAAKISWTWRTSTQPKVTQAKALIKLDL